MRMHDNAQEIQYQGETSYARRLDDEAGSKTVEDLCMIRSMTTKNRVKVLNEGLRVPCSGCIS
jgi:hypothetical protein